MEEVKGMGAILGKEAFQRFKRDNAATEVFNRYDGSDEILNELRAKKQALTDKYNTEYHEIQDKINERILEVNDFSKYEGAYVRMTNSRYSGDLYMHVLKIERLNNGARVYGPAFIVNRNEDDNTIYDFSVILDKDNDEIIRIGDEPEIISIVDWNVLCATLAQEIYNKQK